MGIPERGATAGGILRVIAGLLAVIGTTLGVAAAAGASTQVVTTVTTPTSSTVGDQLSAIACPSATDCIAVGTSYPSSGASGPSAIAEQWNGTSWAVVTLPPPSGTPSGAGSSLAAVACPTSTTCFAVGIGAYEWNGGTWSTVNLPAPAGSSTNFMGMSCPSPTLCFVLGGAMNTSSTSISSTGIIDEWSSGSWSSVANVPQPSASGLYNVMTAISCPSATACLAVGTSQPAASGSTPPTSVADEWNGTTWSSIAPSPSGQGLSAVGCATTTTCFLAGPGTLLDWNGSTFTSATMPGSSPYINALTCVSATACYAEGLSNGSGTTSTLLDAWDGTSWSKIPTPNGAGPINALSGLACPASNQCFAVGYSATCGSSPTGGTLVLSVSTPQVTPSALSQYTPVTPARICDTRANNPSGLSGGAAQCDGKHLVAGSPAGTLTVQVSGNAGVPSGATGVVVNVTVTGPTSNGYLTVWPDGAPQPLASNLNFSAGETIANLVQVELGTNGALDIYNSNGTADVLVDVEGYFTTSAADAYNALAAPARIADTRCAASPTPSFCAAEKIPTANAALGTIGPKGTISIQVTGVGGVPASGPTAVVLNVTATGTSSPGYLTVWPDGTPQPTASNLNWPAGTTIPNRVVVPVGSGGKIDIFNAAGSTNVIVDVGGYYAPTGNDYASTAPVRLLDTRSGKALGPGGSMTLTIDGVDGIPSSGLTGVVLNVTVTGTTSPGYLAVYPTGDALPAVSDLNWSQGETIPNLVVVGVGSGGSVTIYNAHGTANVIADVEGWYEAPPAGSPAAGALVQTPASVPAVSVVRTATSANLSPHC